MYSIGESATVFICWDGGTDSPSVRIILFFQQVVKEVVQIVVQILHQVTTYNDRIIVSKIELANMLFIVIFEHKAVWLEDAEMIYDICLFAQNIAKQLCYLVVEVFILVFYPLLNNAAGNLVVICLLYTSPSPRD